MKCATTMSKTTPASSKGNDRVARASGAANSVSISSARRDPTLEERQLPAPLGQARQHNSLSQEALFGRRRLGDAVRSKSVARLLSPPISAAKKAAAGCNRASASRASRRHQRVDGLGNAQSGSGLRW